MSTPKAVQIFNAKAVQVSQILTMTTQLNNVLDSLLMAHDYISWRETWNKYIALDPNNYPNFNLGPSIKPLKCKRSLSLSECKRSLSSLSECKRSLSLSDIRIYDKFPWEHESIENENIDCLQAPLPRPATGKKRSISLSHCEWPITEPGCTGFQSQTIGNNVTDFPEPLPSIAKRRELKRKPSWHSRTRTVSDDSSDFEDQTSYKVLYSSKRKLASASTKRSTNSLKLAQRILLVAGRH